MWYVGSWLLSFEVVWVGLADFVVTTADYLYIAQEVVRDVIIS
jgi:hypothetical protein